MGVAPLYLTISNLSALLTFAHCPNFRLRVPGRRRTVRTGLFTMTVT
jgi:hypothetical protein